MALFIIIRRALGEDERGLKNTYADDQVIKSLAVAADGDARRSLVLLELAYDVAGPDSDGKKIITKDIVDEVTRDSLRHFDRGGDIFYEQISALHKSVRGSDPDAALYWFCRMVDGGCDPHYIVERLGSPEGELAIAQAVIYLASAAKSNATYQAYKEARQFVTETGNADVPMHLRNAPTDMMKSMGYGSEYQYDHDASDAVALSQSYFPDETSEQQFYRPVDRGLEKQIAEKLNHLREQRSATGKSKS